MSEAHVHVHAWSFPLVATSALIIVGLIYFRGWFSLRKTSPGRNTAWRLTAFMSGLLVVWTAAESPLAMLDHRSLTMHMVKHLLLMTIAAPLLLAGKPLLPLLQGLPGHFIQVEALVSIEATRLLARLVTHPVFCWLAGTMTVIGWHLPVVFELALQFHWVHRLEDGCFLLAGFLFWWPVMQSSQTRTSGSWFIALYLFLATLPCDILSAFLAFCGQVVYPSYLSAPRLFNMSPLQDQEFAGALMWVFVTFAYLLPAVMISLQILSPQGPHSHEQTGSVNPTGI